MPFVKKVIEGLSFTSCLFVHYALFIHLFRGIAMGWTGVDISNPLLPEAIPEIDANPLVLVGGGGGGEG